MSLEKRNSKIRILKIFLSCIHGKYTLHVNINVRQKPSPWGLGIVSDSSLYLSAVPNIVQDLTESRQDINTCWKKSECLCPISLDLCLFISLFFLIVLATTVNICFHVCLFCLLRWNVNSMRMGIFVSFIHWYISSMQSSAWILLNRWHKTEWCHLKASLVGQKSLRFNFAFFASLVLKAISWVWKVHSFPCLKREVI